MFLDGVRPEQQFVQTDPAFVTRAVARLAADRRVQRELSLVIGKLLGPLAVDGFKRAFWIFLPRFGLLQLQAVLFHQRLEFVLGRHMRCFTFRAKTLAETLREHTEQGVSKIERIHPHVQKSRD